MSGNTQGHRLWYERSETELAANQGDRGFYAKGSGWQTESEFEDASQCSTENCIDPVQEQNSILQPAIGQRLRTILENSLYTDVKFVVSCGIKPKPSLQAHKAILAVGNSVFDTMFKQQEENEHDLIHIYNTPFHAFQTIVEYIYTDEVYFERGRDAQVMEILTAAKSFQVPALEARCVAYLESSEVTEANVCSRLQLVTANQLEEYKKHCLQFIQDHTSAVIRSPDFLASDLSTVRNICKLSKLFLSSEMELFEGVLEWVKAQPDSHNNKRKILEPLLRHIRFLSMTTQDFSRIVSTNPDLFTAEEALSVIVYLSKPASRGKANLPQWCNKTANRCTNVTGADRNPNSMTKKISICLRPVKKGFAPNLICELALKCTEGNYKIKALKLSFGNPVSVDSSIGQLIISVYSEPNYYAFKEHITIHSESEVIVPFTQNLLARRGNIIHIRAEAISVKKYFFLQFDEQKFFLERSPFECRLNSEPKGNRLFFISEIIYEDIPMRKRPVVRHRQR